MSKFSKESRLLNEIETKLVELKSMALEKQSKANYIQRDALFNCTVYWIDELRKELS